MKLNRKKFTDALSFAADVADRKGAVPILANVLVRKHSAGVEVIATDTRTTVSTVVEANDPVEFTCPAGDICAMVGGLDSEEVAVKANDGKIEISGGGAKFTVGVDNPRDFPELPVYDGAKAIDMDAATLASVINGAAYAADAMSPLLKISGIWLDCQRGHIVSCATTGHHMAFRKVASDGTFSGLVNARAAERIAKLIDGAEKCSVTIDKTWIHVRCGVSTLSSRLVESDYVPYQEIVKNGFIDNPCKVERVSILSALKRVLNVRSTDKERATFGDVETSKGAIRLARQGQTSKGEDSVKCDGGAKASVYCNLRYLVDALEHFTSDEIELHVKGELDQINMRNADGSQIAVMMPARK